MKKICFISESPFSYRANLQWDDLLNRVKINKSDYDLLNIVTIKLGDRNDHNLEIKKGIIELKNYLSKNSYNLIAPLGNLPMNIILGFDGVINYRGSILRSNLNKNQKVIPTINPEKFHSQYDLHPYVWIDLGRIKKEGEFPGFDSVLKREFLINNTYEETITELDRLFESKNSFISLDIETNMSDAEKHIGPTFIKCVGLADSPIRGICIPFVENLKIVWSLEKEKIIWRKIRKILISQDHYKIIQNTSFEYEQLYRWVGEITPIIMDTMLAQRTCYPELKKGLATIASIHTSMPYYKGESKGFECSPTELYKYNCKDITVTIEAGFNLLNELEELGMEALFHGYIQPFQRLFSRGYMKGLPINKDRLIDLFNHYKEEFHKHQKVLDYRYSQHMNTYKNTIDENYKLNVNSAVALPEFLYKVLKLQKIKSRKSKTGSDKEALKKLKHKYPNFKIELELILKIRSIRVLISSFLGGKLDTKKWEWIQNIYHILDDDGMMRPLQLVCDLETGRNRSKKNIRNRGCNIQNQPKEKIRAIYEAKKGYVMIVGDLSQVEARFVAYLSRDIGLMNIFKSDKDIHKAIASWIFNIPFDQVIDKQRTIAKPAVHGANYNMGYLTFALKTGIPNAEGKIVLTKIHNAFPGIRLRHENIKQQLSKNRTLCSIFGRVRQFFGRWGDGMFREAYASVPQGMAPDLINMAMLRVAFKLPDDAYVAAQVHDEGIIIAKKGDGEWISKLFKEEVEIPISIIKEDPMIIPLDVGIGKNWLEAKP